MYTLRSESRAVKRMIDLMNSGKYPEALKVAEGCIKRFPKEAIFYDNAASLCFKFRDVEKIKFYAEKALSLKGDLPTSLMCM